MKNFKKVLLTLAVLVLLPVSVFAKEKINVYIFKGEGCGYCARALTFFNNLDSEYKNYFNLVEKEVWYDKNNAAIMQSVASSFGIEVKGVPFIIVGDKTWNGYTDTYNEEIKSAIKSAYENEDGSYKDLVAPFITDGAVKDDNSSKSAVTIIIILAVVCGVIFLIYMAKDTTTEEKEEVVVEEKKSTPKKVVTENKTDTKVTPKENATEKKTTTKKTTTAKKANTKTTAKKTSTTKTTKSSTNTKNKTSNKK